MNTLNELVEFALEEKARPDALLCCESGAFHPVPSDEIACKREGIARALFRAGVRKGEKIAILSENRPEWLYADMAALLLGAVTVPLYPSLPSSHIRAILQKSGARRAFVSTAALQRKILEASRDTGGLSLVVSFDPPIDGESGIVSLDRFIEKGKGSPMPAESKTEPFDTATILFTSGTTGEPKGVRLTHANIVENVKACFEVFPSFGPGPYLSLLPLCHILERMGGYYFMLYHGIPIAFCESFNRIGENLRSVKPTVFIAVPRILEKMRYRIVNGVKERGRLQALLFNAALRIGAPTPPALTNMPAPGPFHRLLRKLADALLLSRVRAGLGGRLLLIICGGAALPVKIGDFFLRLGIPVFEGYGLTETSPVLNVNRPDRFKVGSVGPPLPGVEIRLDDDGEILARGPNVMEGYFEDEAATKEAFVDGWFRTGDVGFIDGEGHLHIVDRKKDIFVTSAGKNIAPQPIEAALECDPFVAQAVLTGNGRHFVSAILVPHFENLRNEPAAAAFARLSSEELVRRPEIVRFYRARIRKFNAGLPPHEAIKKFILSGRELTFESGELTPTMKVRRSFVEQEFRQEIERLYR